MSKPVNMGPILGMVEPTLDAVNRRCEEVSAEIVATVIANADKPPPLFARPEPAPKWKPNAWPTVNLPPDLARRLMVQAHCRAKPDDPIGLAMSRLVVGVLTELVARLEAEDVTK